MKPLQIIGVILIVLGVAGYVFGGVSVKKEETQLQVGPLKVTAETKQNYLVPPWLAGLVIAVGAGLFGYGFVRKR
ncbi:MAG: hypothetical protein AB7G15_02640 [Alphaproteobacteria bacterium]